MRLIQDKKYMYVVHDEFRSQPRVYYSFTTRTKALKWIKAQKGHRLIITRTSINPPPTQEDLSQCQSQFIS